MITPIKFDTRESWLAARSLSLGASESPIALGESPWGSPFALWAEKAGRLTEREKLSQAHEERMDWGLRLEEPIGRAVAERFNRVVQMAEPLTISYHEKHPFLAATLDATQEAVEHPGPGVLQIKTGHAFAVKDWKDGPPLTYRIQLQQEIAVSGLEWGSLVCLVGGQRLLGPFDEDRDPAFESLIVPELCEFWRCVREGIPPDTDNRDATAKALARYRTRNMGEPHVLCDEAIEWAAEYRQLKDEIRDREKRVKHLKNKIMAEMLEEGDGATLGLLKTGGHIELREVTKGPYEVKRHTVRSLHVK